MPVKSSHHAKRPIPKHFVQHREDHSAERNAKPAEEPAWKGATKILTEELGQKISGIMENLSRVPFFQSTKSWNQEDNLQGVRISEHTSWMSSRSLALEAFGAKETDPLGLDKMSKDTLTVLSDYWSTESSTITGRGVEYRYRVATVALRDKIKPLEDAVGKSAEELISKAVAVVEQNFSKANNLAKYSSNYDPEKEIKTDVKGISEDVRRDLSRIASMTVRLLILNDILSTIDNPPVELGQYYASSLSYLGRLMNVYAKGLVPVGRNGDTIFACGVKSSD